MTIDFSCEVKTDFGFDPKEAAQKVIDGVLSHESFDYEVEVGLLITSPEEVRALNNESRGIDAPTDVLSFPMIDFSDIGDFNDLENHEDVFNPETGEAMLGDIVICYDRVLSQAKDYGHSVLREYAFLIAHSMLHLLGYDHINEDERSLMEERQREILDGLGITRD